MKVKQILEAKTAGGVSRLAYVQMIDDRYGTPITTKYVTSAQELEQLKKLYDNDKAAFEDSSLGDIYGAWEVFDDQWNDLKKSITKSGSWSTEFEDGSIAISAKGPKHAAQLAKIEFMKAFDQGEEDDDEDWY